MDVGLAPVCGRRVTSTSTRSSGWMKPATPTTSSTRTAAARMLAGISAARPLPASRAASLGARIGSPWTSLEISTRPDQILGIVTNVPAGRAVLRPVDQLQVLELQRGGQRQVHGRHHHLRQRRRRRLALVEVPLQQHRRAGAGHEGQAPEHDRPRGGPAAAAVPSGLCASAEMMSSIATSVPLSIPAGADHRGRASASRDGTNARRPVKKPGQRPVRVRDVHPDGIGCLPPAVAP